MLAGLGTPALPAGFEEILRFSVFFLSALRSRPADGTNLQAAGGVIPHLSRSDVQDQDRRLARSPTSRGAAE
ncbi:MAG: hypothetical protein ABII12_15450, partial [Planctomycetota bacterium]